MAKDTLIQALLIGVVICSATACRSDSNHATNRSEQPDATSQLMRPDDLISPVEQFGELFTAVQLSELFADSKTFVDMEPRRATAEIMADYRQLSGEANFDLAGFVNDNFEPPPTPAQGFTSDPNLNLDKHIERLWPILSRPADAPQEGSLIELPHGYVVPGGRFREIYYWDSYFTMLGLLVDGQEDYAQQLIDNFAYLIDEVGHVPNGNRTYYLSRSQPPFFGAMVSLLATVRGDSVLTHYLPQLEREYAFWMAGADRLDSSRAQTLRVVRFEGRLLNRYFDELPRPRPEGFVEDSTLAKTSGRNATELYTDLRAACESGWDFSSRWLSDTDELATIRTTQILPVDLNCLLYHLEQTLARAYELNGQAAEAQRLMEAAYERRRVLLTYAFDEQQSWFLDIDLTSGETLDRPTLAGLYPLYFGLATEEQAAAVAQRTEADFLKPGGLVTSLVESGQQWDAPNGWAPLQWIAVEGLRRYGHDELAKTIAGRWLASGRRVYRREGKIVEKYNVLDTATTAGGGEYPNQDGFGWSNGVFAKLIEEYPGL